MHVQNHRKEIRIFNAEYHFKKKKNALVCRIRINYDRSEQFSTYVTETSIYKHSSSAYICLAEVVSGKKIPFDNVSREKYCMLKKCRIIEVIVTIASAIYGSTYEIVNRDILMIIIIFIIF